VPGYLTNLPRWVLWRTEQRVNLQTGELTATKPPISWHTGKHCDITNPRSWTSFANVVAALGKSAAWDGAGFVLGDTDQVEWVIGTDIDECLDEDEAIEPWALDLLVILNTYTDKSPGRRGLKTIARVRATDIPEVRKLLELAGNESARTKTFGEKTNGHHAPGAQLFLARKYFTITGRSWHGTPEDVALLDLKQIRHLAHWFGPKPPTAAASPQSRALDDDETEPDDAPLRDKLTAAFVRNPRLRERWEGGVEGLNDTTRSGRDMSVVAMLVAANFTKGETRAALRLFEHGKLGDEPPRYFEQMWTRTIATPHTNPQSTPDGEDAHPPRDDEHDQGNDAAAAKGSRQGRILTGDAFISSFVPPDWLIDGVVQRGRLYACTSLTGHGKTAVWSFNACMIQAGRMIGQLEVCPGNVLYLAGENPEDLKARMHGMVSAYKLKPAQLPYILPGNFPLNDQEAEALMREITGLGVPISLIVGDTASSFFPGDDENDNVQAGGYARTLRRFTVECNGLPTVVALCHPIKNASRGNLLPRGGGAFLNELDGNTTLWSESRGEVTELHWQGKIRGPDFSPLGYRLRPVETGFIDRRDRPVMTIVAETMSEEAVADHAQQTLANEDVVLRALRDHPEWSFAQMAREAGWVDENDQPMKPRVQRAIASLAEDKLVVRPRRGARWELTEKGEKAAGATNQW
jgi:hypothetical protein